MKRAQIIVLGIAVMAGVAAMYLANSAPVEKVVHVTQPAGPATIVEVPSQVSTIDVLVAAVDVNMGATVAKTDMRWQAWPKEAAPINVIRKSEAPTAIDELGGSIARTSFVAGEPVRREKLIMANGSGFMSAILPAGMRALAISIDNRGSTSAGGFILPNDRVDVIRTFRDDEAGNSGASFRSETVLSNIRVLAIGQSIQEEKDGKKTVIGETATLELDPRQAETITLAQKVGQLSLSLRSIADSSTKIEETVQSQTKDGSMTIVRYGVSRQSGKN
jgi:pilus assembly protein CpaB